MPYFECNDEEACRVWKAAVAAEREACAKVCDFEVEPKFASVSCSQCGWDGRL